MTLNLYYEARGESELGQSAIAWVTMNRVASRHFPSSVCGVVFQKNQFSWYSKGKKYRPTDLVSYRRAEFLSRIVMDGYIHNPDPTNGADHYHATSVYPRWANKSKMVASIGRHRFYSLYK